MNVLGATLVLNKIVSVQEWSELGRKWADFGHSVGTQHPVMLP